MTLVKCIKNSQQINSLITTVNIKFPKIIVINSIGSKHKYLGVA